MNKNFTRDFEMLFEFMDLNKFKNLNNYYPCWCLENYVLSWFCRPVTNSHGLYIAMIININDLVISFSLFTYEMED